VGQSRQCSPERKKATTLRPILSRRSGRKCSKAADWRRRRAGRLSVRRVLCEREESEGGFLKPWQLSGAGQKERGKGGHAGTSAWREKEGEKGGPWCSGW
jgi:hypothetical protein